MAVVQYATETFLQRLIVWGTSPGIQKLQARHRENGLELVVVPNRDAEELRAALSKLKKSPASTQAAYFGSDYREFREAAERIGLGTSAPPSQKLDGLLHWLGVEFKLATDIAAQLEAGIKERDALGAGA